MRIAVVLFVCLLALRTPVHAGTAAVRSSASTRFFIADSWLAGFTYGLCTTKEHRFKAAWKRANRTAANDVKIWAGLFASDPNKQFGGRLWETVSRFSWQLPQTVIGLGYTHFENTFGGNVDTVHYFHGATVTTGRHSLFFGIGGPAVTLGNFVVGNEHMRSNVNNYYFQHEYGHYLQSQATGIAYFGCIAIPNIRSEHGEYKKLYESHDYHPTEQDANRRAFLYFNRKTPGFKNDTLLTTRSYADNLGWEFRKNPMLDVGIPVVPKGWKIDSLSYVDYNNPEHVASLEKLRVRAKWYDYVFPIVSGFYNSYWYNHVRNEETPPQTPPAAVPNASAGTK